MTGAEAAAVSAGIPAAAKLFASVATRISRGLTGAAKAAAVNSLAALQGYGSYLEETNQRVSTFKTFANPAHPVSLIDHFVTTKLAKTKKVSIDQDDVVTLAVKDSKVVISATAGFGKSMLMRFVALSLFENPRGRIPIFIELRHLNRIKNPDIMSYIHLAYRRMDKIDIKSFNNGLNNGIFSFLFDGFDELNHEIRPIVESQILQATRDYPKNAAIVSGRPDDRFSSWREFTLLKILPMTKMHVVELIEKLDYDRGTKKTLYHENKKGALRFTHELFVNPPSCNINASHLRGKCKYSR